MSPARLASSLLNHPVDVLARINLNNPPFYYYCYYFFLSAKKTARKLAFAENELAFAANELAFAAGSRSYASSRRGNLHGDLIQSRMQPRKGTCDKFFNIFRRLPAGITIQDAKLLLYYVLAVIKFKQIDICHCAAGG